MRQSGPRVASHSNDAANSIFNSQYFKLNQYREKGIVYEMDANLHLDMGCLLISCRVYNKLAASEPRQKLQRDSFCRLYNIVHYLDSNFYRDIRVPLENFEKDARLR